MAQPKAEEKKSDADSPYDPLTESQVVLTADDLALTKKVEERYGDRLGPLCSCYPHFVRRFVVGYAHEADREKVTFQHIDHFLDRHDSFGWPTILDAPMEGEEAMFRAWPNYIYGFDRQGHPVLYDEIASTDLKLLDAAFARDDNTVNVPLLRRYRYRFWRRLANAKRVQSDKLGTAVTMHCMVLDLSGFSKAHFGAKYRNIVKEVIVDEQNLFPETLDVCILINAPVIFRAVWKIVSKFIDPLTVKKIRVLGKNYIEEMTEIIPLEQIPPKFGGKGENPIKLGHSADLPHDRYPLDFFERREAAASAKGADDRKGSDDNEMKEQ